MSSGPASAAASAVHAAHGLASYLREGIKQTLNHTSSTLTDLAMAPNLTAEDCRKAAAETATWVGANPALAASAVLGTVGVALVAAPALLSTPLLSVTGFAGRIQGGSLATVIHASLGNVVAGTPFAIAQSAGAGGAGLAVVNGVVQGTGGVMAAGGAGVAWIKSKL